MFVVSESQGGGTTETILRGFVGSPTFRRSFSESPDPWGAEVDRHGPLLASEFAGVTYERISHGELIREVREVLEDPSFDKPPSGVQQEALAVWLESVVTDECFALRRDDNGRGEVDWNHVWLVFREFVCIAPGHDRLTVAVLGVD